MDGKVIHGDCLEVMRGMDANSVDLVFTSPPYESQRTYSELNFNLKGQAWVDWAMERYLECLRVSRGLVAWVIEGYTKNYKYSATPALLMADLHRAGVCLRKPPVYYRHGVSGSGGPDWLRNDWEWIVCASSGKLPWSNNTAMGKPPKWKPGGPMSHRTRSGARCNESSMVKNATEQRAIDILDGKLAGKLHTKRRVDGSTRTQAYVPPDIANPGNVVKCKVGGGRMGSALAHENEAPFTEEIAEFFIRSFCPPGGIVLDPFSGSGTTAAVAKRTGRSYVAIDLRESQVELTNRRLAEVQYDLDI